MKFCRLAEIPQISKAVSSLIICDYPVKKANRGQQTVLCGICLHAKNRAWSGGVSSTSSFTKISQWEISVTIQSLPWQKDTFMFVPVSFSFPLHWSLRTLIKGSLSLFSEFPSSYRHIFLTLSPEFWFLSLTLTEDGDLGSRHVGPLLNPCHEAEGILTVCCTASSLKLIDLPL